MDITYIPMARGFVYLAAVVDWFSRRVLAWKLSITMDVSFCIEALEEALSNYGKPEIFNTDQGSQFTSEAFTGRLKKEGIQISMDGKGRWCDNVFVERLCPPQTRGHPAVQGLRPEETTQVPGGLPRAQTGWYPWHCGGQGREGDCLQLDRIAALQRRSHPEDL
jgi:hypothetical protein